MSLIFDIKRYSINDGPGIRTTVFVKGCPLRCVWCHNPESWISLPQRLYKENKCIGCGGCIEICPQGSLRLTDRGIVSTGEPCVLCGKCADNCPALAMEICGKEWDEEELLALLERERSVMENGNGGVTISGGEPLMHPEYTLSLLRKLGEEGYHRAVDTTLFAPSEIVKAISGECELFLVDIKSMDDDIHKRFTGVSNQLILDNIRLISSMNHPYFIRIPLIKGVNATDENILATAHFLKSLERKPEVIDILPYHDIGKGKHERMGSKYNPDELLLETPIQEEVDKFVDIFRREGLEVRIGG